MRVKVIGAGLAGCEAALQLANRGIEVDLYEMKPKKYSPAHKSGNFAELVCSNSLKADRIENACGLLKEEMRLFGSVIIHLTGAEKAEYDKNSQIFAELGFENEEFGERDVIIRTSPSDVEWADVEELFLELLTKLSASKKEVISDKFQRMIYTIACKAAIKANHTLTASEMERLVRDVLGLDNINTCPHGRPIIIKMTKKELEKNFKRIV